MLPAVLSQIVSSLSFLKTKKKTWKWISDQPTNEDIEHIKNSTEESPFDPYKLRKTMLEEYKKGKVSIVCKSSSYAKVIILGYPGTRIDWNLLGNIFLAIGPPTNTHQWRVVLFASPSPRLLPSDSHSHPAPENINGGYTYVCDPRAIVIYRLEEWYRVLIHELLHAACTDNMELEEPIREAYTETWAELFLIGVLSEGSPQKALRLWKKQSQWIVAQESILTQRGVINSTHYSWRYLVSRRSVLEEFSIPLPPPMDPSLALSITNGSLKFTCLV